MKFTGERFVPNQELGDEIKIEHLQRYYSIVELVKDKVVLDAASGEGYGTNIIAEMAKEAYGLDIDEESISHATNTYIRDNLKYFVGSIAALPFEDNFFDVVVSFETIEHVNENIQRSFLKEIKRVLKNDGVLIISTPDKHIYSDLRNYKNEFHVKEFYQDEYKQFLNEYFSFVDLYFQKQQVNYILDNNNGATLKPFNLSPGKESSGKYMVAVCSGNAVNTHLNSIVLDEHGTYNRMINRILELQDEVDGKNGHLQFLDKEIEVKDGIIKELRGSVELKNQVDSKKALLEELNSLNIETMDVHKELSEMLSENKPKLSGLNNRLFSIDNNISEQVAQLLEKEKELNTILNSNGWRILTRYYQFRDSIIPPGSKRRLLLKTFRNLPKIVKLLNKENAKKFFYYLKTEDPQMVQHRLMDYVSRYTNKGERHIAIDEPTIAYTYEKLEFPKSEKPKVSIIIPVYNNWKYTYLCLKSILENTEHINYEVIIADDMSTDETIEISRYAENIVVVRDGENRGFLLNCNNAAQYAQGEYIFFLNNDTQVQEGWLDSLVQLIESDESIGMVGSKLVYPDGRLQEAGGIIWNDASGWNYGRLDDPNKPEYNYVKEVDYISGAAIMIRKRLWEQIGSFDKRYVPAYFEDSDLAFEVRKHGYKVMYQPKSVVVHFEGISHGTDVNTGLKSYQVKNKEKFIEKWQDVLQKDHFVNGEDVFWARDKSGNRKTILVVDHYVPHYDKDAGSRTTYQYLKLFVEMGFNVKFLGDNFYNHEPYTTKLQELGIEVFYGEWYSKNIKKWLENNGKCINVSYLNRPHISIKYIDLIRKYTKSKIIYYGHDLHYLRELREYTLTKQQTLLKSSDEWKKTELELCSKADVVYYPSQIEVDELNKEIKGINAKAIPAYIFENNADKKTRNFEGCNDLLFVGGFNHKPNMDAVIWFVNEIFPLVLKEIPTIKFYIVGSNPPESIKQLESDNIKVMGYVSDEELERFYVNSKLVVVPLRYGAGVKGKVVEAMYHQAPIITTSVGAEGLQDLDNELIIEDNPKEFAEHIIKMYMNDKLLEEQSAKLSIYIAEHFSKEAVIKTIGDDFNYSTNKLSKA